MISPFFSQWVEYDNISFPFQVIFYLKMHFISGRTLHLHMALISMRNVPPVGQPFRSSDSGVEGTI